MECQTVCTGECKCIGCENGTCIPRQRVTETEAEEEGEEEEEGEGEEGESDTAAVAAQMSAAPASHGG